MPATPTGSPDHCPASRTTLTTLRTSASPTCISCRLRPRAGDNDGGYAVQDYRAIRPDLAPLTSRNLAATLRSRGISLVVDLVLNHVAREHEWAVAARGGDPAHRDYFHVFPDRRLPDAYEQALPEVFPAFAPGNFSYEPELGGWVWTTFNEWQWDLNWSNPAVLHRVRLRHHPVGLANLGVEVLRLDAIAFVWKRMGTTCQNQPEVHAITQAIRAVTRMVAPAVAFKAEAMSRRATSCISASARTPAGERPCLSQQPDGADLVDAGRKERRTRTGSPHRAARCTQHRHLDHLRSLP